MNNIHSTPLLLVGSIPYDTVQEVLETFGAELGPELFAMPDGEVGPRRHWISRIHYQIFAGHPELEILRRPRPDDGVERLNPHDSSDGWMFGVKQGVKQVRFGDPGWRLGFARDAINSYFIFRTYREKGVIPQHLRFQVSIPSVVSATPPRVIPDAADRDNLQRGYLRALKAEIAMIVSQIPADDLALQWDCATEVQDVNGAVPELFPENAVERNITQFRELCSQIPEEVALGFHFCFGTLGGWPRFQPKDLGATVDLVNATVEVCGRPVTWVHLPVLDTDDPDFYSALGRLRPQGARVFLGLIHNMERFPARLTRAREAAGDVGIGAYCGFGRMPGNRLTEVLEEHRQAVTLYRQ